MAAAVKSKAKVSSSAPAATAKGGATKKPAEKKVPAEKKPADKPEKPEKVVTKILRFSPWKDPNVSLCYYSRSQQRSNQLQLCHISCSGAVYFVNF